MAQVRKALASYPISKRRKRAICTGIAVSIWRAMQRGEVRAGPQLADFLAHLLRRLRDAHAVGGEVRSWCSWAGWAVQSVLNERAAHAREIAATERLVEEIERERDEARRGFIEFLEGLGVSSLREYVSSVSAGEG